MQRQPKLYFFALSLIALALLVWMPSLHVKADDADRVTYATFDPPGAIYSEGVDINSRGDIVGRFRDGGTCNISVACAAPFDGHNHGFLLRDGKFTTIDPPGSVFTGAIGISPPGDIVVGVYKTADLTSHGFLLRDDEFTTIDFPRATFTGLHAINRRGDIVGEYRVADISHGFLLRGGEFTSIDFPGAVQTNAWRINSAGDIAGRYKSADGKSHVFLLSDDEFTSIDFPGAFDNFFPAPLGLNDRGDIASHYCKAAPCTLASNGNFHGFLLSQGQFNSFDFPDSFLTAPLGMNNRGDIVGAYKDGFTSSTCTIAPACAQIHGFVRTRRRHAEEGERQDR